MWPSSKSKDKPTERDAVRVRRPPRATAERPPSASGAAVSQQEATPTLLPEASTCRRCPLSPGPDDTQSPHLEHKGPRTPANPCVWGRCPGSERREAEEGTLELSRQECRPLWAGTGRAVCYLHMQIPRINKKRFLLKHVRAGGCWEHGGGNMTNPMCTLNLLRSDRWKL